MNESGIFKQSAKPEVWTNGPQEGSDRPQQDQWWAFGFWCGDLLCLIPLADDVPEARRQLWLSPLCTSEEDAKRIWFLVKKLMLELESPEISAESVGALQHALAEQKAENKRLLLAMRAVQEEVRQSL